MDKIRVSAVSYLNSIPFVYGLETSSVQSQIELSLDIPSECANKLLYNQVDLGLVPVAIIPQLKFSEIISPYCISANGPVETVCLFSQVPLNEIEEIREPIIKSTILCPDKYVGDVIELAIAKRGVQKDLQYLGGQVSIIFEMPLSEIVMDFFDLLKSKSQGYASVDFVFDRYQKADLVKVDVAVNGLVVDSLSSIMHRSDAQRKGRDIAKRLREVIPRQMFEIPIQIMLGSKIIARESVKAFRKNVTAKLYGGDVTRKKKLLEKQKAGKKKMKQIGKVALPQEAFLSFLSTEKNK